MNAWKKQLLAWGLIQKEQPFTKNQFRSWRKKQRQPKLNLPPARRVWKG